MRRYNDTEINKHYVYLDDNNLPILLPCLFARYTQYSGLRITAKVEMNAISKTKEENFIETEIGDDQAYKISNHLGRFLEWIDQYKNNDYVKLSTHTALPSDVINEYINDISSTFQELGFSESTSNQPMTYQRNVKYPSIFPDKSDYAHFVVHTPMRTIQVVAKFQESSGTAIEKLGYTVMDAARSSYDDYLVVW